MQEEWTGAKDLGSGLLVVVVFKFFVIYFHEPRKNCKPQISTFSKQWAALSHNPNHNNATSVQPYHNRLFRKLGRNRLSTLKQSRQAQAKIVNQVHDSKVNDWHWSDNLQLVRNVKTFQRTILEELQKFHPNNGKTFIIAEMIAFRESHWRLPSLYHFRAENPADKHHRPEGFRQLRIFF